MRTLVGHTDWVSSLCIVSAAVLASGGRDRTIKLWDLLTGAATRTLTGHSSSIWSLCIVSQGVLASGSYDSTTRLWQVDTGTVTHVLARHSNGVQAMCMMSQGVLASASWDRTARVWDVGAKETLRASDDSAGTDEDSERTRHGNDALRTPCKRTACAHSIWNGECYTSYVLLPLVRRQTYNEATWKALCGDIRRNRDVCKVMQDNGQLALPERALAQIEQYV